MQHKNSGITEGGFLSTREKNTNIFYFLRGLPSLKKIKIIYYSLPERKKRQKYIDF